jgi:hypothetical protein
MICFKSCRSRVNKWSLKGMFESVVVVAFQSVFHAEMHQNDIFFFIFKKIIFKISASKRYKKYKKN